MDRISNLPDDVLCHILSFLTTKEAALTSILCKRWRNLIAFVPNLDIDDSVNLYSKDNRQLFMDFVDRVLALQGKSPINKFSLHCVVVDSDRIDAWIRNVMLRGVSELILILSMKSRHNYRLYDFDNCWLDGSKNPMLKTLVLDSVPLSPYKFENLLHALPALEELVLRYIHWNSWDADVIVSSASLKTLTIYYIGGVLKTLGTPSLVNFSYSDWVVKDYSVAKMENLLEARISLSVTEEETERARAHVDDEDDGDWLENDEDAEDNVVLQFGNVGKLMNGIQNVQCLYLSANTLEVLSLCCESMPVFNNLKSLTVESDGSRGWQAMPVLIRNCPHLETLVLEGLSHHVTDKCEDACGCVSQKDKGRALTSCPVKMLEIKGFQGTMKEMHMIKHFLDYFPSLKEIKFYMKKNGPIQLRVPEVSEVIREMMVRYKKSSSCIFKLLVRQYLYEKWTAQ